MLLLDHSGDEIAPCWILLLTGAKLHRIIFPLLEGTLTWTESLLYIYYKKVK